MANLQGKTALVTGSSRGIGRAIALKLAREGARVAVHCRNRQEQAREVALECGQGAIWLSADLGDPASSVVIEQALEQHWPGRKLDIVVHNAATSLEASFEKTLPEDLERLITVNLKAPFFLTQRLLPRLAQGGRILFLSSQVARLAFPSGIAYSLTKGAIETLTRQLAAYLGDRQITVNAIAPGTVETEMCPWLNDPQQRQVVLWQQALQRLGQPEDVAELASFLVGPGGDWITGQVWGVNGGCAL